ncbi:MAG: hypothetical protein D6698_16160, partial [Gammaproteobacteria bacterium]
MPTQNQPTDKTPSDVLGASIANTIFGVNIRSEFRENVDFKKDISIENDANISNNINLGNQLTFNSTESNLFSLQENGSKYIISSGGLAVGGATDFYIDTNGNSNLNTATINSNLTALGEINLGDAGDLISIRGSTVTLESGGTISLQPASDTDDFVYINTSNNQPGLFFAGAADTHDPGIRINANSGQIEYRDQNTNTWIPLDNLDNSSQISAITIPEAYFSDGGSYLYPSNQESVRIYDSSGTNYLDISHNGSSVLITTSGTSDINFDNNLSLSGTLTLPSTNILTGNTNYITASKGISVGGNTTYGISSTGAATVSDLTTSGTISLNDGGLLDLSAISHDDSANQGLRLPVSTSLTNIASGQPGYIAWDATNNRVVTFNGSSWTNISGATSTLNESYVAGNTIDVVSAEGNLAFDLQTADFTIEVGQGADTGDLIISDGSANWFFIDEASDTLSLGSAATALYLDDQTLSSPIPLTVSDSSLNPVLTPGIIDALNDLYDISTGGTGQAGYFLKTNGIIYPYNSFESLVLGGVSSASANINLNAVTGTASLSGSLTLTGDSSSIGTILNKPLNIGNNTTGDIYLSPNGTQVLTALQNGNLGIGTTQPQYNLDIQGTASVSAYLGFGPTLQSDLPTCNASTEGAVYYDATANKHYFCDSTNWKSIAQGTTTEWTLTAGVVSPNSSLTHVAVGGNDINAPFFVWNNGDLTAAGGTFTGALSVQGNLTGSSGSFSGNLAGDNLTSTNDISAGGSIIATGGVGSVSSSNSLLTLDGNNALAYLDVSSWDTDVTNDYVSWTISDGSNSEAILSSDQLTIAAGTSLTSTYNPSTNTLTIGIDGLDNYTAWSFAIDGTTYDQITSYNILNFVSGNGIDITRTANDQLTIAGELASYTNPGIASFDPNNFTITAGLVNTAQDIHTSASPVFAGGVTGGNLQLGVSGSNTIDTLSGNISIRPTTNIGSSSLGLRINPDGSLEDLDGSIVLNDTVAIGSSTTGLQVDTNGALSDIDSNYISINDDLSISGTLIFAATNPYIDIANNSNLTFRDASSNPLAQLVDSGSSGNLFITGGISTFDTTVVDGYGEFSGLCLGNGSNCITAWGEAGVNYWQLNGNSLAPTSAQYSLAVGGSDTSDSPFYVFPNGDLTAAGGTFTGNLDVQGSLSNSTGNLTVAD